MDLERGRLGRIGRCVYCEDDNPPSQPHADWVALEMRVALPRPTFQPVFPQRRTDFSTRAVKMQQVVVAILNRYYW